MQCRRQHSRRPSVADSSRCASPRGVRTTFPLICGLHYARWPTVTSIALAGNTPLFHMCICHVCRTAPHMECRFYSLKTMMRYTGCGRHTFPDSSLDQCTECLVWKHIAPRFKAIMEDSIEFRQRVSRDTHAKPPTMGGTGLRCSARKQQRLPQSLPYARGAWPIGS